MCRNDRQIRVMRLFPRKLAELAYKNEPVARVRSRTGTVTPDCGSHGSSRYDATSERSRIPPTNRSFNYSPSGLAARPSIGATPSLDMSGRILQLRRWPDALVCRCGLAKACLSQIARTACFRLGPF